MAWVSLLLTFIIVPTSARPVALFTPTAPRDAFAPIDHDVVFDIVFALAFFALLGSIAWLASRWTAGAQLAGFFNRHCAVPIAFCQQLSAFIDSERAAVTNNANAPFVPRKGGASYPVATFPGGLQGGGPKRVGVAEGIGDHPAASSPSMRSIG